MHHDLDIRSPIEAPPTFRQFRWPLLIGVCGAIFFAVLIGRSEKPSEEDYISAQAAFASWEQSIDGGEESFAKLKQLLQEHPELQSQYDGPVGQALLAALSPQQASLFIDRAVARVGPSHYSDYAQISLQVVRCHYREALEASLALKGRMVADSSHWEEGVGGSTLFAFNLLRIATLSQQVGDGEGELAAWSDLKRYAGWETEEGGKDYVRPGFRHLLDHFSLQEATLLDYVQGREQGLKVSSG